jgi:hypothetical protein
MLRQRRSLLLIAACFAVALSLASCSRIFPSLPVSEEIHVRNGELEVEFLVCQAGEIQPTYISRVDVEKNETRLPALALVNVEAGGVYGLGQFVDESIQSTQAAPLLAGERVNFSFELLDDFDRQSQLTIRTVFIVDDEAINGFAEGLWLSPSGVLAKTPCV